LMYFPPSVLEDIFGAAADLDRATRLHVLSTILDPSVSQAESGKQPKVEK